MQGQEFRSLEVLGKLIVLRKWTVQSFAKLSKARHSFPDKWHLKSNDFFLFCGQEYLIHFSFQQCTKSSCKEMEGKEMTPLFRIWVRDVVYSLIPCWLFVINTTPLHSWSCLGSFTNYVHKTRLVGGTENVNGMQIFPYKSKGIISQMLTY